MKCTPTMTEDANLGPLRSVDGFEQLALARRSVRRFSDTPVPEAVMHSAFRSAHLAPSSNNLQPWEFHWVRPTSSDRAAAVEACLSQPAAATSAELVFFIGRPDLLEARAAEAESRKQALGIGPKGHTAYWRDQAKAVCTQLSNAGTSYQDVAAWCEHLGKGRPSGWPAERVAAMVAEVITPNSATRRHLDAWVGAQ